MELNIKGKVTGKTLISMGYIPAPWFGNTLKELNDNPTKDIKEVADNALLKYSLENKEILDRETPAPFLTYLTPETKEEKDNYNKVIETMTEACKGPTVKRGYIMPDACPAGPVGTIPVGGVIETKNTIHPGFHSADVCCSVMSTEFVSDLTPKEILDKCMEITHFGPVKEPKFLSGYYYDHDISNIRGFDKESLDNNFFTKGLEDIARAHFATQGDGNHFLFLGRSRRSGNYCLVTHHGSRGFGAKVFKRGLKEAKKLYPKARNPWLDYDTTIGKQYWEALSMVEKWTAWNHFAIHSMIMESMEIEYIKEHLWNKHNFVDKIGGKFYHYKGATPMYHETPALIPLNMSEPILVVSRFESGFAPHGAGRNFSRNEFKKNVNILKEFKAIKDLDVRFYSGEPDLTELPGAYKNADKVISEIKQHKLAIIRDYIDPLGCIMAGNQKKKTN